ncbi:FAD-dependent oxidoreductase [uncultured Flavobacterium sp.]|uniref:FAD-dependent oxidoreductase n=1 Tax=uncultured Flavobacterium sp. TaxID=165435 RepID=UPI003081EDC6
MNTDKCLELDGSTKCISSTKDIRSEIKCNHSTEILVIGTSAAGISAAYWLRKSGRKVILAGTAMPHQSGSGRITANIANPITCSYYDMSDRIGVKKAAKVLKSYKNALEWTASVIRQEAIQCGYKEVKSYLFPCADEDDSRMDKEYAAARSLRLPVKMLHSIPSCKTAENKKCLQLSRQSQCDVASFLNGLLKAFIEEGGIFFDHSNVEKISDQGADINGYFIQSDHVVLACDTLINKLPQFSARLNMQKAYRIGVKIPKGTMPFGFWSETRPLYSQRVSGPNHNAVVEALDSQYDLLTAEALYDTSARYEPETEKGEQRMEKLALWTKMHFPSFTAADCKWSGEIMQPCDLLPLIGRSSAGGNIFIVKGSAVNEISDGALGALIIKDLINGKRNSCVKLYAPSRTPMRKAGEDTREIRRASLEKARKWLAWDISTVSDLRDEEGRIITAGDDKIAAYRDKSGKLHLYEGTCPHSGMDLEWNKECKTFDSISKVSRFCPLGIVLSGRSDIGLQKKIF